MTLTRYTPGSLRELFQISVPLMVSSLAMLAMLFVDRLFLAQYSMDAHNAAVNGATLGWACLMGWIAIASISEVFVAQYNGAKEHHRMGNPVWQMIWFSLFSFAFFFPLSWWGTDWIYGSNPSFALTKDYFRLIMLFGPSYCLYGAITGFFIAQGKTHLITILAIGANLLNALLDWLLIFGVEGWIPSFGVKGAAIATNIGELVQIGILFALFLRKKNRQQCGTAMHFIDTRVLGNCIKIGLPNGIAMAIEVGGYALFYYLLTHAGEAYITLGGICQNFMMLFFFLPEGLNKATMTIAGNMIGAKQKNLVPFMLKKVIQFLLFWLCIMLMTLTLFHSHILSPFITHAASDVFLLIRPTFPYLMPLVALGIFFEGVRLSLVGILTAAGDTRFILYSGSTMVWFLLIIPVYWLIVVQSGPFILVPVLALWNSVAMSIVYALRFYGGKWRSIELETTPSLVQSQ